MVRPLSPATAAIVLLLGSVAGTADAQDATKYPRLRSALHELREARDELKAARDVWPAGYKDRALNAIGDAITSVKTILAVKDVETFRGVDRNPDFYKGFKDNPRLRAALKDLRDARGELHSARADFKDLRERAIDDIDVATGDILTLLRYNRR